MLHLSPNSTDSNFGITHSRVTIACFSPWTTRTMAVSLIIYILSLAPCLINSGHSINSCWIHNCLEGKPASDVFLSWLPGGNTGKQCSLPPWKPVTWSIYIPMPDSHWLGALPGRVTLHGSEWGKTLGPEMQNPAAQSQWEYTQGLRMGAGHQQFLLPASTAHDLHRWESTESTSMGQGTVLGTVNGNENRRKAIL